jgi:nitrite reductase/ring-hydroxylating ferredoxin subunit
MPVVYHTVARVGDLQPGELCYVEAGGKAICLANVDGEIVALDNACTHERAPLSDGAITGDRIECPLHGGAFNVRSGEPMSYPAVFPVKTYRVEIDGDQIRVGIRS